VLEAAPIWVLEAAPFVILLTVVTKLVNNYPD